MCSFLEMALSFVPTAKLRKIFPPLVTGVTVVLIGASLIGDSGFLNWGGGSNGCQARPELPPIFHLCPTIFGKKPLAYVFFCLSIPTFCSLSRPNASLLFYRDVPDTVTVADATGLGFLSFITIVIVEIFGSPSCEMHPSSSVSSSA